MAVHADAAHEQVDAAVGSNLGFVIRAFFHRIGGHTVEDVDVLRFHVHQVIKEIVVHEVPVGLVMFVGQTQVFVHVEGNHVGEAQFPGLVHAGQFPVHADGGRTGGQTQYERTILFGTCVMRFNTVCDIVGGPKAHFFIIILNNDSHYFILLFLFTVF